MTGPIKHSVYSPSGSPRWLECHAAPWMERGKPDSRSKYAAYGTAVHFLAADKFTRAVDQQAYDGWVVRVLDDGRSGFYKGAPEGDNDFPVDDEMLAVVDAYDRGVSDTLLAYDDWQWYVEEWLDLSDVLGQSGAGGTADLAVIGKVAGEYEIAIHDLKTGRGEAISAEGNTQLMLYALGLEYKHGLTHDFKRARLYIHQPRLGHISEAVVSIDDLRAFGERARAAAARIACVMVDGPTQDDYRPAVGVCDWCKARAECPALRNTVAAIVMDGKGAATPEEFECLTAAMPTTDAEDAWLAASYTVLPLVENWVSAVAEEVRARLLGGRPVPGYKLVEGKRGSRAWTDETAAERALAGAGLSDGDIYERKLITPTKAEKALKKNPAWAGLADLIVQPAGKPTIAPQSDKRPPYTGAADLSEFD